MKKEPECYAVRLKDMNEVKKSRSGGFFISLCRYIIQLHGVVYGCSGKDPHHIIHSRANTIEGCYYFRNSKYVQSLSEDTFRECAADIANGKIVLFSGTGCQIQGLLNYLKESRVDISRLVTVDLVCHGVPSPGIWQAYIAEVERICRKKVKSVNFRDKSVYGWKAHKERIDFEDGTSQLKDVWTNLFYSNTILRPSCSVCPFASTTRNSDFTIGDYWGIERNAEEFDDDKGVNLVLINTEKGRQIFGKLQDINYTATSLLTSLQPNLCRPSTIDLQKRQNVMNDFKNKKHKYFVKKYLCMNSCFYLKAKIINKLKSIFGAVL